MKKIIFCLTTATFGTLSLNASILLAGWDFNNSSNSTTTQIYRPSNGPQKSTAGIYVDGSLGSSNLLEPGTFPNQGERNISGSGYTVGVPFLNTDTADGFTAFSTSSNKNFSLFNNVTSSATLNGKSIVIGFSTLGATDITVNMAALRGTNGPNSNSWAWSLDGTTFTPVGSSWNPATGSAATYSLNLSAVNEIENKASVYLRLTLNGQVAATQTTAFLNFDNMQIGGTLIPASAINSWRETYFPGSGPEVDLLDPDSDGLNNLLEYAFGTHPLNPTTGPVRGAEGGKLTLTLGKNAAATDVTITVQGSDSVSGPWDDLASSINGAAYTALVAGVNVTETSPTVEVSDQHPIDGTHPKRFLRVQVVGP